MVFVGVFGGFYGFGVCFCALEIALGQSLGPWGAKVVFHISTFKIAVVRIIYCCLYGVPTTN